MTDILNSLMNIFFPSKYTSDFLSTIPRAPEPQQKNIFSLYDYQSPLGKKLIYDIKTKRDFLRSQNIAEAMYIHLQEYLSEQSQFSYYQTPVIIPVPLTPKQKKTRGFNQILNIAKKLSQELDGIYLPAVIKINETRKQALIKNRSERFLNVRNVFAVKKKMNSLIYNKDIIIVDDLVTTGATLVEIEKTLRKAGARNVMSITVGH